MPSMKISSTKVSSTSCSAAEPVCFVAVGHRNRRDVWSGV